MNATGSKLVAGSASAPPPASAVTRRMLRARTRELAVAAGRNPLAITQSDYEQARRELTGESDMDRQEARLDAGRPPAAPVEQSGPH